MALRKQKLKESFVNKNLKYCDHKAQNSEEKERGVMLDDRLLRNIYFEFV